MKIGTGIKLCRLLFDISQIELADAAGIFRSQLSRIEAGNRINITLATASSLSKAMGIPLFILIYMASESNDLIGVSDTVITALNNFIMQKSKETP